MAGTSRGQHEKQQLVVSRPAPRGSVAEVWAGMNREASQMTPQEVTMGLTNAALAIIAEHKTERAQQQKMMEKAQAEERQVVAKLTEFASNVFGAGAGSSSSSRALVAPGEEIDRLLEKDRMRKHRREKRKRRREEKRFRQAAEEAAAPSRRKQEDHAKERRRDRDHDRHRDHACNQERDSSEERVVPPRVARHRDRQRTRDRAHDGGQGSRHARDQDRDRADPYLADRDRAHHRCQERDLRSPAACRKRMPKMPAAGGGASSLSSSEVAERGTTTLHEDSESRGRDSKRRGRCCELRSR